MLNNKALGLIFPNSFDAHVARMVKLRAMASLPFASRYRLVDFVLSSMSNCGIDNVYILPNRNYLSLMDHLGSCQEWDLNLDYKVKSMKAAVDEMKEYSSGMLDVSFTLKETEVIFTPFE